MEYQQQTFINIRLDQEIKDGLKVLAAKRKKTMSEVIQESLIQCFPDLADYCEK